ncbi:hypothetical protein [Rhizobium sp. SSA_523]|uniref:DUF6894 family protein n=1 Tax=Rhizobium sp. SSA_523 TaxID=2952477 RepID=UPI0020904C28|nr:hypothetical protein [Rhizobium sp. SSA_523]MCO5734809.1 hypothetical protein [Rhizobium sp. SSA_523]WKC21052.1 hypothetical protein QTJ18_01090 [Rhizobium sp. SSA_523]
MPQFFLHLIVPDGVVHDSEGSSYPDLTSAKTVAIRALREIVSERLMNGLDLDVDGIQIAGADGELLVTVTVLEAVAPTITAEMFQGSEDH